FAENSAYYWEVTGGEIIEGQGTSSVKVKWELDETGIISVLETNAECSGNVVEMDINLSLATISENHSIARLWNEALLVAIRGDFARPTVHARNLFHTGIAMYDAWAIYDNDAKTYLIGKNVHGYTNVYNGFLPSEDLEESRNKTISYAAYRLLKYRFRNSPGVVHSTKIFDLLMSQLGYDTTFTSTDYSTGNGAALGNFIAESVINYGFTDGARESSDYDNAHYEPVNPPLAPVIPGNNDILDPNRWQPLSLETFIDQAGNLIPGSVPDFLSPEWGDVSPFALTENLKTNYQRSGNSYSVFHDPQEPPYLDTISITPSSEAYKWGFSMVSIWGSHLDPHDNIMWDISPKSIGNVDISELPQNFNDLPDFYNLLEGGDVGTGHVLNPYTQSAYAPQIVPRGDYARVLAEFWADGPDSETPPGHWFTILNYVNDNELLERKLNGIGDVLNPLEWDVKAYFILSGAMHDAAITSWSIKGWYDYLRPISAIRFMAGKGQSTDATKDNYDLAGIPLREGFVESVEVDDPLSGENGEHVGKIKLFTWRGHDYISDTNVDEAGVGWILAENWWPYQRPTFVTPPFAGYVSGHSTYSRAAAEVMTMLTGDEFFPGGLGEFVAKKNEFLVFEEGPSVDVKLQWATYRDASDQCSLSRIWGGIHPPADDIPGRLIGEKVGKDAYNYGVEYFYGKLEEPSILENSIIYPNPITNAEVFISHTADGDEFNLYDIQGRQLSVGSTTFDNSTKVTRLAISPSITPGFYILKSKKLTKLVIIER
ncbi:MAG: T9SS type A sorting domain-containing protein, partial [Flavobacteriaceae bacterium]|nr:T9SS type A sorting domain-containing protein [Flavobacteriaceae bacterium]